MKERMNPYEKSGMYRSAVDFAVDDDGMAFLPRSGEIVNQQGIERIGEQFGVVQILATGLQSTEGEDHPQKMTLFASRGKDNHLHHYAFWYGSERERQREMLIGTIQECPGMYFNLDCGCSQRRDHVVSSVFHQDADASLLLSFDPETTTPYRLPVARGVFEALGIRDVQYLQTNPEYGCDLQRRLTTERSLHQVFYTPDGRIVVKSHDMPVRFIDGDFARMIVYEEQPLSERRSYGQKIKRHYVLIYGDIHDPNKPPIARYHSSCKTAEHGGNACDCRLQREKTLQMIREHGSGILIYADEEGMGLGAVNKFWQTHITISESGDIYKARDLLDMPSDVRTYGLIDVLHRDLRINRVSLASNNRGKKQAFEVFGVEVVESMHLRADYDKLAKQARADILAKIASGRYDDFTPKS